MIARSKPSVRSVHVPSVLAKKERVRCVALHVSSVSLGLLDEVRTVS